MWLDNGLAYSQANETFTCDDSRPRPAEAKGEANVAFTHRVGRGQVIKSSIHFYFLFFFLFFFALIRKTLH
jgi:hypothetical protein